MAQPELIQEQNILSPSKLGWFNIAKLTLRIIVIGLTLSAAIISVTSDMTVVVIETSVHASYTESSAFSYKVIADFLVCGLSLLSVILVIALESNPRKHLYLFLNDLVMVVLLLSASAAATAIAYVAKLGEAKASWTPVCDFLGKFCDRIMVSIVLSYVAFVCVFVLTVISAHKLQAELYLERIRSET